MRISSNNNRAVKLVSFYWFLLLVPGIVGCWHNQDKFEARKLPSGRIIKMQEISEVSGPWGHELLLVYETSLKIADKTALPGEVDEIWSAFFREEAERRQFNRAAITAQEEPKGRFDLIPNFYQFTYLRQPDGRWVRSEKK